jgi:hypothetical protein
MLGQREAPMRQYKLEVKRTFAPACLALGLLVAGCMGSAEPSSCDGISARAGGCDEDQPTYSGTTCAELAREWGDEVDRRLAVVIDGPAVVDGEAKSARQTSVLVLASTRLSMYMDGAGLLDSCDLPEFLPIAEQQFSDKLREGVGSIIYDGEPVVSYEEWPTDAKRYINVIDMDDAS